MERINGETITGIALVFLSLLFIYAGTVNKVWATIFLADFIILALGGAFIALGIWTLRNYGSSNIEEEEHSPH